MYISSKVFDLPVVGDTEVKDRVLENAFSWGREVGGAGGQDPLNVKIIGRIIYASWRQESLF